MFIQNIFSVISDEFQKAIKLAWDANGLPEEKMPTLVFNDIDERDLKVFAEAWSKLAATGVVQNDLETENAIRSAFKLPFVVAKEALHGDNTQGVMQ